MCQCTVQMMPMADDIVTTPAASFRDEMKARQLFLSRELLRLLRVVSVLDSGAEGPGSNRSRDAVLVLGKLFTPIVPQSQDSRASCISYRLISTILASAV